MVLWSCSPLALLVSGVEGSLELMVCGIDRSVELVFCAMFCDVSLACVLCGVAWVVV